MAEDIAESGVDARIETAANCIKRQETEAAGARCPGQGRRYRIQSRDELRDDENRRPITGKSLFSPAIMGFRISCEAVNEVQDLVAVPATPSYHGQSPRIEATIAKPSTARRPNFPAAASVPAASRNRGPGTGKPSWCANKATNRIG